MIVHHFLHLKQVVADTSLDVGGQDKLVAAFAGVISNSHAGAHICEA